MLNAELRVVSGKQTGNVIPLVAGRFLIGREEDCHLRPGNDLVSRHHCVFKTDEYTVRVRDLGSTNGTFVNGERLRGEVMLNTGDKVRVGTLEFEVVIGEEATGTEADAALAAAAIEGESDSSQTMIQGEAPYNAAEVNDTTTFQGDTVYQPQPQPHYDPTQQPVYGQPMIGYQMPYPQYPYGQPYGMPMGYPQQPMPYPPMYPQQPMPMPMPPTPTPVPEPPAASDKRAAPPVTLPDPSQTGAKPPEPPAAGSGGSKQSPQGAVSNTAMDIIKQYTQRRPGGAGK
jgi:predicted component of type VI protein secretion system